MKEVLFQADPWPPFGSPGEVRYSDRWPLPEAAYNAARRRFTPKAMEKIRRVLKPPVGFPLEERLRLAVYNYHHLSADLLCHLGPAKKKAALEKMRKPVESLLALLEGKPLYFAELYQASFDVGRDLAEILKDLKRRIDQAEAPMKRGNKYDHAKNVFFAGLHLIFEETYTGPERGKLAKAFRFFKTSHNLLIAQMSDKTIERFIYDEEARRRAFVYLNSHLLS